MRDLKGPLRLLTLGLMTVPRSVLAIIPARSGSKGLPGKNSHLVLGRPLIEWTVARALEADLISKVVVSTDDESIADIARRSGAVVPFIRPSEIASDESKISDTVTHCLSFFEADGECFDDVLLLEPTSPLRTFGQIDEVIRFFWERLANLDGVITVGESRSNPAFMKVKEGSRLTPYDERIDQTQRRQENPEILYPYGVAYLSSIDSFTSTGSFYPKALGGFPLERYQEYEIDDVYDLLCVEAMMIYEWSDRSGGVCENWVRQYLTEQNSR